jgi:hypothetical protein
MCGSRSENKICNLTVSMGLPHVVEKKLAPLGLKTQYASYVRGLNDIGMAISDKNECFSQKKEFFNLHQHLVKAK